MKRHHDVRTGRQLRLRVVGDGDDQPATRLPFRGDDGLRRPTRRGDRDRHQVGIGAARSLATRVLDPGRAAARADGTRRDEGRVAGAAETGEPERGSLTEVRRPPPVQQTREGLGRGRDVLAEGGDPVGSGHAASSGNSPRIPSVGAHSQDGRYVAA